MKSSFRFLAAFSVAALLGAGCWSTPLAKPPTQPPAQGGAASGGTQLSTRIDIPSVTTKKGKTDSLRNLSISSSDGKTIQSPLQIFGEARLWYFEAVFPVELRDSAGRMIGLGPAQASSDWMTEDWVPFEVQFAFPDQPAGSRGTIVMMNDNPSGLEENSDSFEIPVTF
ncbi:Gmad2 immunoglobulin-like domain-containing protein [Candidatus Uhrbacteria bacterium]|nr:Gmad2 immunoglobulin-like domain-containing protein [Candidatus Uhrbacteria bacterium]